MCKLLFFDTESGNGHTGSICSFGYVLTDENFNIIEEEDIFMNPEKKWEKRVLEDVLYYPKEHYEKYPPFKEHYEKIKSLFKNGTIIFGHAIENDIIALNDACKRYNLPYIDFKYYGSNEIFKEFIGAKNARISLDKISEKLGVERQMEKHTSLQDAQLVMLQVKEMCNELETSIMGIIEMVDYCDGENKDGQYKKVKIPISYETNNNLTKGKNNKVFSKVLENIDITHNKFSKYNNKRVSISSSYEYHNSKEMLLIVRLLAKQGSFYARQASLSNYYVVVDDDVNDIREKYVDEKISKGKKIIKIKLEDFLNDIGFKKEDVEENYKETIRLLAKKRKSKKKDERKTTLLDFANDEIKELFNSKKEDK